MSSSTREREEYKYDGDNSNNSSIQFNSIQFLLINMQT
jgi:hypothetical protein